MKEGKDTETIYTRANTNTKIHTHEFVYVCPCMSTADTLKNYKIFYKTFIYIFAYHMHKCTCVAEKDRTATSKTTYYCNIFYYETGCANYFGYTKHLLLYTCV